MFHNRMPSPPCPASRSRSTVELDSIHSPTWSIKVALRTTMEVPFDLHPEPPAISVFRMNRVPPDKELTGPIDIPVRRESVISRSPPSDSMKNGEPCRTLPFSDSPPSTVKRYGRSEVWRVMLHPAASTVARGSISSPPVNVRAPNQVSSAVTRRSTMARTVARSLSARWSRAHSSRAVISVVSCSAGVHSMGKLMLSPGLRETDTFPTSAPLASNLSVPESTDWPQFWTRTLTGHISPKIVRSISTVRTARSCTALPGRCTRVSGSPRRFNSRYTQRTVPPAEAVTAHSSLERDRARPRSVTLSSYTWRKNDMSNFWDDPAVLPGEYHP